MIVRFAFIILALRHIIAKNLLGVFFKWFPCFKLDLRDNCRDLIVTHTAKDLVANVAAQCTILKHLQERDIYPAVFLALLLLAIKQPSMVLVFFATAPDQAFVSSKNFVTLLVSSQEARHVLIEFLNFSRA